MTRLSPHGQYRILMVCLGNICRSPLMEGVVRHKIEQRGIGHHFHIDSAGTGGWHAGEPPDKRSIAIAKQHGIDISHQRARQIQRNDQQFDWILCADSSNQQDLRQLPFLSAKSTHLFLDFAGGQLANSHIPDPYYGGMQDFAQVFQLIDAHADAVINRILAQHTLQPRIY
jgi:protein-tyrosine phosphatase